MRTLFITLIGLATALAAETGAQPVGIPGSGLQGIGLAGIMEGGGESGSGLPTPPSSLGTFNIVINPGAGLASNPFALAAFERAAATWESHIADPILVTIDAELANLGASNIIGSAGSMILVGGYDLVRDQLVTDASTSPDEAIVAYLPTAAEASFLIPSGFGLTGNLGGTKANLKALGFEGLDEAFGVSDAQIEFNSNFSFDYDRADGITPGTIDFESVALHEIGHALGFISAVDDFDYAIDSGITSGNADIFLLDLFRFADGTAEDPATAAEFTMAARSLQPGVEAVFDTINDETRLSTGVYGGDSRQASHWKDGELTGIVLGAMDPTIATGQQFQLSAADLRAFDLIGWDIVTVIPEPSAAFVLMLVPLLSLVRRRPCQPTTRS